MGDSTQVVEVNGSGSQNRAGNKAWLVIPYTRRQGCGEYNKELSLGGEEVWKPSKDTLTLECLGQSQHNQEIKSDTLFLAALGLPPT